jgi:hypothetical protein
VNGVLGHPVLERENRSEIGNYVVSLEITRIRADFTMVYKINHKLVNINFEDFFTIDLYEKTCTNGLKLKTEKHRPGIRKHFFTNRSIKIWN